MELDSDCLFFQLLIAEIVLQALLSIFLLLPAFIL